MNLLELAEKYNRLIRETDKKRFAVTSEIDAIIIHTYRELRHQEHLRKLILPYQVKLDDIGSLPFEDISNLARNIVNAQFFCDGNHRTALFLCYHLAIFCNNKLPRISPYLLYAAIDFEYLKSMNELTDTIGTIFKNNAIYIALFSRSISTVITYETKKKRMDEVEINIIKIPDLLGRLSEKCRSNQLSASSTVQIKMFRQFAGQRNSMEHSVMVNIEQYRSALEKKHLLHCFFNPQQDINNPHGTNAVDITPTQSIIFITKGIRSEIVIEALDTTETIDDASSHRDDCRC